jgi:hypothetical protein
MTLLQAIDAVKAVLLEDEPEEVTVDIVLWSSIHDSVGVRVAEITWLRGNSGASLFQTDPGAAPIIFAVERHILHLMHIPEEAEDSLDRLRWEMRN